MQWKPEALTADINGLQIGATGIGTLQFEVFPDDVSVTVKLTAEEARWLAWALGYWADVSEGKASPPGSN